MKFLKSDLVEIQLEHCGRKYKVSSFFIILNNGLFKLKDQIYGIDEEGYLLSKRYLLERICLPDICCGKPIGLFKFDNNKGGIMYRYSKAGWFYSRRFSDWFDSDMHFFCFGDLNEKI